MGSKRGIVCNNGWRPNYNSKTVKYNCPGDNCETRVEAVDFGQDTPGIEYTINANGAVACPGTYDAAENPNGRKPFYDWESCQYKSGCDSDTIGTLTDDCGAGPQHELVCCGSYRGGWRKPNKDHGGIRACCSEAAGSGSGLRWYGNMYNMLTQCCVDGDVVTPGGGGPLTCG